MAEMPRTTDLGAGLPPVLRLGLATRGNTNLPREGITRAIEAGVRYLNWCGHDDAMSETIAAMSAAERKKVVVATQLQARSADGMARELDEVRESLGHERIDVGTLYYVESKAEWKQIIGKGGALETLQAEKQAGRFGLIGMTSHQRKLLAKAADTGLLDLAMVRYNAAHRGAEKEVFPVTRKRGVKTVVFTVLRWGALGRSTPDDPPGFEPPGPPEWYRFVLGNADVDVALAAPTSMAELAADLALLNDWRAHDEQARSALEAHGDRVHKHAGAFP